MSLDVFWLPMMSKTSPHQHSQYSLRWRHNGRGGVSNHQPHDCLLNRLFRRRSKKTSTFRVTCLCAGNSPGTGEFLAQMASNAKHVSILMTSSCDSMFIVPNHCFKERLFLLRRPPRHGSHLQEEQTSHHSILLENSLIGIGIPIINLKRSSDRLRVIMRIPIPVRRCLF